MAGLEHPSGELSQNGARFATTHWSLVLAAGGTDSHESRAALGRLLESYWYPLCAFVRRKGMGPMRRAT
jgi:RNA polymerase sigma-70 factor (ECF subfamily)